MSSSAVGWDRRTLAVRTQDRRILKSPRSLWVEELGELLQVLALFSTPTAKSAGAWSGQLPSSRT